MRKLPGLVAVASSLAALAVASPALADASAWVFLGGGALGWRQPETTGTNINPAGTMVVDVGAGTSPDASAIFGGLFRFQPVFPGGIDVALLARFCTHGFQAGDWGVAIDAGGFVRPWGLNATGGFTGSASLGMPLGFTLMLQTEVGISNTVSFGAVAGIDLLRLTLYRQTLLNWWQNPSPAWKSPPAGAPTAGGPGSFHF